MSKNKITNIEAIMLLVLISLTHIILSLPKNIIVSLNSASIINLFFISIVAILIVSIIVKLLNNFNSLDILDISELVGGKIFKNIIGVIFILYFIFTSSLLLRNFCETLKIVYYPMTNILFILSLFVISICYVNRLSLSAILKTNIIIVPIAIFSILFLFFANVKNFMPNKIFPLFGNGFYDTFILGFSNLSAFGGIAFLYFLPPFLADSTKTKKISILSLLIISICLILSVSTLLFMFSIFETTSKISPLYSAARYIEFGKFFQRLESIFLLIWILLFASYLSIITSVSLYILKKVLNLQSTNSIIDILGLAIFSISLFPENYAISLSFEKNYYPFLVILVVFLLSIGILIIANFKKKGLNS